MSHPDQGRLDEGRLPGLRAAVACPLSHRMQGRSSLARPASRRGASLPAAIFGQGSGDMNAACVWARLAAYRRSSHQAATLLALNGRASSGSHASGQGSTAASVIRWPAARAASAAAFLHCSAAAPAVNSTKSLWFIAASSVSCAKATACDSEGRWGKCATDGWHGDCFRERSISDRPRRSPPPRDFGRD
jgi:hypothetical protein